HNLGAIMRVAAHYGVAAIISEQPQLLRSGAAVRTAEGGASWIKIIGTDNLVKSLQFLKKCKFSVLATSSHESQSLYAAPLPERSVLVLGEEQNGVSRKLR
ncbi:TrmH family RNA methyltransferase, partial [Arthrospira platensis SPKY1]|nr:TrmH family RNA methyltransferase [Arthrospira platensis SPKY1]